MKQYFSGLRARLLLLVLFALVPLFIWDVYVAIAEREYAAAAATKEAKNLVQVAAREHQRLIQSTRQYLTSVSKLPEIKKPSSREACARTLAEVHSPFSYYRMIGLALADGTVYCRSIPIFTKVNITDRGYFQRAVSTRDFGIGDYQIGRATLKPSINFGQAVLDERGNVRNVVFAALDIDWLNELLAAHELPPQSSMEVLDRDGTILARHPNPEAWVGKTVSNAKLIQTITSHKDGIVEMPGLDGVNRVYAFAPLFDGPNGTAFISVGLSTEVAFAGANDKLRRSLVLLLIVGIVVFALVWWIGDIFVLRRVQALAAAAKRIGEGDLSARTGLPHEKTEEIGQLASAFDRMAQGLELMTLVRDRVHRALETLSACNRAMVGATSEQELLREMCETIVKVGGYRYAWIGYADHTSEHSIQTAAQFGSGHHAESLAMSLVDGTWDIEKGRGLIASAIRMAKPRATFDLSTVFDQLELAAKHKIGSAIALPLTIQNRAIAALLICAPETDAFNTEEFELLYQAAQDIAVAISMLRTRVEHDQALEYMAYYDSLTGLPNRAHFEKQLRRAITDAGRTEQPLTLMIIDIQRLWVVNDALGFHHGDQILKDVGGRIRKLLNPHVPVARMRGDEFAILLPGGKEHAATVAEQIHGELAEPFVIDGLRLDISVVIGISLYPEHGHETSQVIRYADVAMHQAKKSGRNVAFYEAEHDEDNAARLTLIGDLRRAIENDDLMLHYQPKVNLRTGTVCGVEALVRWRRDGQIVPPDKFIPLAEQTGLIKPLTEWVIGSALRQSSQWRQRGLAIPVAVNLSATSLHDTDLLARLQTLLDHWDAEASWLEFEITESAVMENPERALEVLHRLRDMGIPLFIDDFGTGYSSLVYLKKLPVDAMKIDKSFVIDMMSDNESATIVRSTIGLAHDLGLKVVAEGVENQESLDRLCALGCDTAQGYFLSKPVPADDIPAFILKRRNVSRIAI